MPSPLSRKRGNSKKPGISRQRNFQPAFKAVNSLVDDIADAEDPEDHEIKSKIVDQTSSSLTRSFTGSTNTGQVHESKSINRLQTISPDSFFKRNGLLDNFDSDSESEDNEDGSSEEQTETRTLTEIERLEEVQTALEEKIEQTKELLQRADCTRNQRRHGQQRLRRLELKLEKLEQRVQHERAGKSQWTFVRRVLRKPKVGFHSSELSNRKVPLGMLAASLDDTRPHLADVVLQEMERKADTVQVDDIPVQKPEKLFKSKALHEFHLSLSEDQSQQESKVEECASENDADRRWLQMDDIGEELQDNFKKEQLYRKEIDKGWLRISDRPEGFVKKVQDISDTKQSKEAWVNINEQGRQMFARKVFRANVNGDSFLSRSLDGKKSTLNVNRKKVSTDGRRSFKSSQETLLDSKDRGKAGRVGRVMSSQLPRTATVVKVESIPGTTSFLPPIPKSEAKKRPKKEHVEEMKDEKDKEQQKERLLLIPNKKRLAKRRMEIYLKQLEFAKSHGLDQKEIFKNAASAVEDYYGDKEEPVEHEAKTTPRNTLYLIGALSKHHLRPPTAPT